MAGVVREHVAVKGRRKLALAVTVFDFHSSRGSSSSLVLVGHDTLLGGEAGAASRSDTKQDLALLRHKGHLLHTVTAKGQTPAAAGQTRQCGETTTCLAQLMFRAQQRCSKGLLCLQLQHLCMPGRHP